jgi:acetyl-CoA carboxylase carboxyl transferase subunit beta
MGMSAGERVMQLCDPGTFHEWERGLVSTDPLKFIDKKPYPERLKEAWEKTGMRDAAIVGRGKIHGLDAVFCFLDFEFMGGTMGSVVGEKVSRAFRRATKLKLPLISVVNSGGARMQEGMLSLMQMAKTSSAAAAHSRAGLLYISLQANPTTGGIAASFSSLGDVVISEPGALVGFVGPRVIEQTIGEKIPPESHTAEFLLEHGMIDAIVERRDQKKFLADLVRHLTHPGELVRTVSRVPSAKRHRSVDPWTMLQCARHPERPTSIDYIARIFTDFCELHGDRHFGDDRAIIGGVAELEGKPVMILALEKGRGRDGTHRNLGMPLPEGYRKAVRLMQMASKFRLPIITFIDTPGAYPGFESEKRGIAMALAGSLAAMSSVPVPVISVVVGEGGSGGALALGVGNIVIMQERAVYSVISPEGAAAILFGDASRARDLAPRLRFTAFDLLDLGIIDHLVPEPPEGAHTDPDRAAQLVKAALLHFLPKLEKKSGAALLRQRFVKYSHMGETGTLWKELIGQEIHESLDFIHKGLSRLLGGHTMEDAKRDGRLQVEQ